MGWWRNFSPPTVVDPDFGGASVVGILSVSGFSSGFLEPGTGVAGLLGGGFGLASSTTLMDEDSRVC